MSLCSSSILRLKFQILEQIDLDSGFDCGIRVKRNFKACFLLNRRLLSFRVLRVMVWFCLSSTAWCLLWWLTRPAKLSSPSVSVKKSSRQTDCPQAVQTLLTSAMSYSLNVPQRHMCQRFVAQPGEVVGNLRIQGEAFTVDKSLNRVKGILASSSFSFLLSGHETSAFTNTPTVMCYLAPNNRTDQ